MVIANKTHSLDCLMMVTLCCCALSYQILELLLESGIAKVHPLKMHKSRKFWPLQLQIIFLDHIVQFRHSQRTHTHTFMNTRMQTLLLWVFSKTEPTNLRDWRSHHCSWIVCQSWTRRRTETWSLRRRGRHHSDMLHCAFVNVHFF